MGITLKSGKLYVREAITRKYIPVEPKKTYPEGTVFILTTKTATRICPKAQRKRPPTSQPRK